MAIVVTIKMFVLFNSEKALALEVARDGCWPDGPDGSDGSDGSGEPHGMFGLAETLSLRARRR